MARSPGPGFANPNSPLAEVNVAPTPQGKPEPRLLDQLRDAICVRHYSIGTEEAYVQWVRRFIVFSKLRHPLDMGPDEVGGFLTNLAVDRDVGASTQNQAKQALLFLY